MHIGNEIYQKILKSYGFYYGALGKLDPKKVTDDALDFRKPKEQIELLKRFLLKQNELRGKKFLEIGSGFGIFNTVARKEYGIDAWGIEPSGEGFDNTYELSIQILKENGLDDSVIKNAVGENLPFPDNTFDVVYSTNVLEHVQDPKKVLSEAIRVCKSGGIIQIIVPNYGSFYEGHYSCFYFPYQPKQFWKWWLRHVLRRNPSFADTLRTDINFFSIKRWINALAEKNPIEIVSFGKEIFYERMTTANFSAWAGLSRIKSFVVILSKLKISPLIARVLISSGAFTPIILTVRKK